MRGFSAAVILLWISGTAMAQAPLGLEEALRLARQNNLQLKKQEQKQEIAELEVAGRRGALLPSLDVQLTTSYTDEVAKFDLPAFVTQGRHVQIELGGHDRTDLSIGLRQPLFNGFRLRTRVDLARTKLESEATRLALLRQKTAFEVTLLFYQAQTLIRERQVQSASLRRHQVQLQQLRDLFRAAQVMAFDTLQVHNQTLQVRIRLDRLQKDLKLVALEMARLLDLPQVRPIAEARLPMPAAFSMPLDSLKQVARRRRPELASIALAQRAARLKQKLVRGSYYPSINAEIAYHFAKPGLNQVANNWMDYGTVGMQLRWNLWRGGQDRRRLQESQLEYARLSLEERELLRRVDNEVERSWENLRFAFKQIVLAQRLVQQQRERYRIVRQQQRNGVATTNDVVVAEADLTKAERQLERTLIEYYLSRTQLLLAIGSLGQ